MIINHQSLDDLFVEFNASFQKGFARGTAEIERIATRVPSKTSSNHYAWLGQFPKLRKWVGDRITKQMQSFDYTLKNVPYESTTGVLRDHIKDDEYDAYGKLMEELGYAAAMHPTELAMELLSVGHQEVCYDGQFFFDSDHPVEVNGVETSVSNQDTSGGGAYWYLLDTSRPIKPLIFQEREPYEFISMTDPKDPSVYRRRTYEYSVEGRCAAGFGLWQMAYRSNQTLNTTNFRAARQAMRNFKSNEGRKLAIAPTLLVAGPTNEGAARDTFLAEFGANGSSNTEKASVEIMISNQLD